MKFRARMGVLLRAYSGHLTTYEMSKEEKKKKKKEQNRTRQNKT
jgi:hypothetical protein